MSAAEFDQIVGSNVGTYRAARGLSQAGLAAAMSADGDHVHPQTIQKIEAGSRPLRYAEALRICKVLKVGVAQLADGADHARANARYLQRFSVLGRMTDELDDFANRLSPILVDLAHLIAFERGDPEQNQAAAHVVDTAHCWMGHDWGGDLNEFLMERLRSHPDLTTLRSEVDATTYADVLKRASEVAIPAYHPDVDPPGKVDDDSET
jgi:transcriptional regulator with XRE-family HTH domain